MEAWDLKVCGSSRSFASSSQRPPADRAPSLGFESQRREGAFEQSGEQSNFFLAMERCPSRVRDVQIPPPRRTLGISIVGTGISTPGEEGLRPKPRGIESLG